MRLKERLELMPSLADLPDDMLLTTEETSAYLGVHPSTLEKWRLGFRGLHGGPPWVPLHDGPKAPVRFLVGDVRAWIQQRRAGTANQGGTPAQVA